jgi:hypothetical protein
MHNWPPSLSPARARRRESKLIHYHGGPITPLEAALACYHGRHAMVSFANPEQLPLVAEVCQSFCVDNGAFSFWKAAKPTNWTEYYKWVDEWRRHPAFDWAVIPDVIEGTEQENEELICQWPFEKTIGVPVWHLHESLDRLWGLSKRFPRVALGSSGEWAVVGNDSWWERMTKAMEIICIENQPSCKLHGLRMLNPEVFRHLPLSSADSTNVARNIGIDKRWKGSYSPQSKATRAVIIAERIEARQSAAEWLGGPIQEIYEETLFSRADQRLQ